MIGNEASKANNDQIENDLCQGKEFRFLDCREIIQENQS